MSTPPSAPSQGGAVPPSAVQVGCLLALTFATGIVDALSWIGLDGVFTANMTGNVLIIGMGIVGAGGSHWFPPLFSLVLFLAGAAVAGLILRDAPPHWTSRTSALLASSAAAVLALGAVTLVWPPHRFETAAFAVTGVLAFAMGVQGAAAIRLAVPTIITVAVSSAVVGLGTSLFLPPYGARIRRQAAAIVLLIAGALVGSLLLQAAFGIGLLVAGAVAAGAVAVGHARRSVL